MMNDTPMTDAELDSMYELYRTLCDIIRNKYPTVQDYKNQWIHTTAHNSCRRFMNSISVVEQIDLIKYNKIAYHFIDSPTEQQKMIHNMTWVI
jgi:hypothetical protein